MLEMDVYIPAKASGSYRVTVGSGLLDSVVEKTRMLLPARRPFVVTDSNLVKAGLLERLTGGAGLPGFIIDPAGEVSKNIHTVSAILEAMESHRLGRDTVVIALGGGTVGDVAAFVASIFKRGVPVVQAPTTTLAQADSAIGGKTGVDSSISKNAFGTFWHPTAVFMDVDCLRTLDRRQYKAGLVESIKHGLIADATQFCYIEENLDPILSCEPTAMVHLAFSNCRIKASVVQQDPEEKGLRRILNYGHTIGHAVESASQYQLLHGEAVAIGLVAAGMIELRLGLSEVDKLQRLLCILDRMGIPRHIPTYIPPEKVMELLAYDKKAVDCKPRFVLTTGLGQVHCHAGQWTTEVDLRLVEEVIKELY